MGKLVECKTCKHQVDQFAKLCPNCGAKNPGMQTYKGCLFFIFMVAIISSLISLTSKDSDSDAIQANLKEPIKITEPVLPLEQVTADIEKPIEALKVPILNDANINDFLKTYADDYASYTMKLVKGFGKYKENNDYHGYVLFKNKQWRPGFNERRAFYTAVQDANQKYLSDNNMIFLVSQFIDLSLRAEDYFSDLRRQDKSRRKLANELIVRDINYLEDLFKKRGLKFEVNLHE